MPTSKINWFKFAAPQRFYPLAGSLTPWFTAIGVLLAVYGLYLGLWVAPTDATQGQAYRMAQKPMHAIRGHSFFSTSATLS